MFSGKWKHWYSPQQASTEDSAQNCCFYWGGDAGLFCCLRTSSPYQSTDTASCTLHHVLFLLLLQLGVSYHGKKYVSLFPRLHLGLSWLQEEIRVISWHCVRHQTQHIIFLWLHFQDLYCDALVSYMCMLHMLTLKCTHAVTTSFPTIWLFSLLQYNLL